MPSLTLTISQENLDRLTAAFEERLGAPATAETIRQYIMEDLKQLVRNAEIRKARKAAQAAQGPDVEIT
jgi:hypothetical protein